MIRLIRISLGILAATVTACIAFFVSAIRTPNLAINCVVAFCVFTIVVRYAAGIPWRSALAASGVLALLCAIPTALERLQFAPKPDSSLSEALMRTTLPLTTVRAESGFADMEAIRPILSGKRIVALGEATHGTREFFQMKHRMLEFLVTQLGFRHYGMELSAPDGELLNQYIHGDNIDFRSHLYWPWGTEEVAAMIEWMRRFNAAAAPNDRMTFHGIDPRSGARDPVMAKNVGEILDSLPANSGIVLWAHNAHISNAPGRMGSYLKSKYGDEAYLLGFEFNQGSFTSRTQAVRVFFEGEAPPHYYAYALARLSRPICFLDFSMMNADAAARQWLEQDLSSHSLCELHDIYRLVPGWHTDRTSWLRLYDGLIFIRDSSPAISFE
jgi:erythromycin esterase-like protein